MITKLLDAGLYPYTKRYLGTFKNHFSTIGLIGMNEVGLNANWLRKDLTHPETLAFTKEVLVHMRERLKDYQEKYGDLYNLEATPAESTTYRLAKHDKEQYPDIITANEHGTPYYTNSSHLPVGYTQDLFTALDMEDDLQTLYTSGTVFHAFLGEKLPDWQSAAGLVRKIANNYKLPYFTLSPTYSICREHGYLTGEQYTCPYCGEKTEVYSRITGYYRPVQNWNDGKVQEFKDRKVYDLGQSHLHKGEAPQERPVFQKPAVKPAPADAKHLAKTGTEQENTWILFGTHTCPNCKMAVRELEKHGAAFREIFAEEHPELAEKYQVQSAPTLLVNQGDTLNKIEGFGPIRAFIKEQGM